MNYKLALLQSQEMHLLENAINTGNILACSDCNSSMFTISRNNISNLVDDWNARYPQLKGSISNWKYDLGYDHDFNQQNKKFEIVMTDNGRKASFIFLVICAASNLTRVECFELCVDYKFETYNRKATGFFERLSEEIFGYNMKSYEIIKNLIQRGTNTESLAAMFISKHCHELKIKWY